MSPQPKAAYIALTLAVGFGTLYSVLYNTYLDTSDPLISSLPHPRHAQSYFARKSNVFNTYFVKQAWGWTTVAFASLWITSPREIRTKARLFQWVIATAVWAAFTTWFFGPSLIDRLVHLSGGECVVIIPASDGISTASTLTVPHQYCATRTSLSPSTHPDIFITPFTLPRENWTARPRYLKGHDVSGHIFLLTMAVLFLADQLRPSLIINASNRIRSSLTIQHRVAMAGTFALSALWIWMCYMTSVYWHTPHEKISGFAIGSIGYLLTRLAGQ